MIICSCNIITEEQIKNCLVNKEKQPSVGTILKELECEQVCGTCSNNIVSIVRKHYGNLELTTDDPVSTFMQRNGKYCHL